jgi:hydroxymethylbilane synthase
VRIAPLRGNLDTRLRKLDDGGFDAIVLAAAGLKRLELESRIRLVFEPAQMLPAAGQGALGIEVRADRQDLHDALAPLAHQPTWLAVAAEREVSRSMGGSCSMPLAAHARWSGSQLRLQAAWGEVREEPDVGPWPPLVRAESTLVVSDLQQAVALGQRVAQQLRDGGARVMPAAP